MIPDMNAGSAVVEVADYINPLLSSPAGSLEGSAMAMSFEPSLMPRSSVQQGIMMGLAGLTVAIDAMNAMVTVPGNFGSFGHDYRADMARMVRAAYGFDDITDEQVKAIEQQLVALELERAERIKASKGEDEPASPQYRGTDLADEKTGRLVTEAGVPLQVVRTSGPAWFKSIAGADAVPEDVQ